MTVDQPADQVHVQLLALDFRNSANNQLLWELTGDPMECPLRRRPLGRASRRQKPRPGRGLPTLPRPHQPPSRRAAAGSPDHRHREQAAASHVVGHLALGRTLNFPSRHALRV